MRRPDSPGLRLKVGVERRHDNPQVKEDRMDETTLLPEGSTRALPADAAAGPPLPTYQAGGRSSLHALSTDYALFTPALLYACGGLDRDVVAEFVNTRAPRAEVMALTFDAPLFDDLADWPTASWGAPAGGNWACVLLACDRPHWPALERFLAGVVLQDRRRRGYARALPEPLAVADALEYANTGRYAAHGLAVPLTAYALLANYGTFRLEAAVAPGGLARPRLVVGPPHPQLISEGAAALGDGPPPARAGLNPDPQEVLTHGRRPAP
jgi:hypothetical protein